MRWPSVLIRLADNVVELAAPVAEAAVIVGDLRERAEREVAEGGRAGSVAWRYLLSALSVAFHFSKARASHPPRESTRSGSKTDTHSARHWGEWRMLHDLRFAARALMRRPGFSLVVIVTLALGVGANTAIFTVVRNVVLRPVPYPDPDRLVSLWMEFRRQPGTPGFEIVASEPEYVEFAAATRSFEAIAGYWVSGVNLSGNLEAVRIRAAAVTANFFDVAGVPPARGRPLLPGEDVPGAARVAVITHGLWVRAFGQDPELLGRSIVVDGESYEVVGIMPPTFSFPGTDVDLLRPTSLDPTSLAGRSSHYLQLIGRLEAGVSVDAARAEASLVNAQLGAAQEDVHGLSVTHPMVVAAYQDKLTAPVRPALWILTGAAALVLLIACANVANLMFARSETRGRELAIRFALGAGRGRMIRVLLLESVLLSVAGAGIGLVSSALLVPTLASLGADRVPQSGGWQVDGVVLAFAVALAVVTSLVFGMAPALSGARRRFELRDRGGATGAVRLRVRNMLLISQLALAIVLLIGAGVLTRNLTALLQVDPGFEPDGVVTMTFALDASRYATPEAMAEFHRRLDARLSAVPAVVSSGAIRSLPLAADGGLETVSASNARVVEGESVNVVYQIASPGYFDALSIPLVDGRGLTKDDRAGTEPVVLINETMADRYWPGGDAIGNTIQLGGRENNPNPVMRIVGVVGNVIQGGLGRSPNPQIFVPRAQAGANYDGLGTRTATLAVKGSAAPATLMQEVRTVFRELDPTIPLANVQTMDAVVVRSVSDERFLSLLLSIFSIVAVALASIGVYGLMSYLVVQRTREIGVRLALGATRQQVLGDVVSKSMAVTGVGIGVGLAAALVGSRLLDAFVTLVSARDPLVFAFGPLVLLAAALAAAYGPARRAAAVDPMTAVRVE